MKMTKKKVFVASLAVCLVAVLSMGTLAWFTATDSVENIFQVSTETGATDADFELTLFESEGELLLSAVLPNDNYKARKVESFKVSLRCKGAAGRVTLLPSGEEVRADFDGETVSFEIKDLDMLAMYSIK